MVATRWSSPMSTNSMPRASIAVPFARALSSARLLRRRKTEVGVVIRIPGPRLDRPAWDRIPPRSTVRPGGSGRGWRWRRSGGGAVAAAGAVADAEVAGAVAGRGGLARGAIEGAGVEADGGVGVVAVHGGVLSLGGCDLVCW